MNEISGEEILGFCKLTRNLNAIFTELDSQFNWDVRILKQAAIYIFPTENSLNSCGDP